MVLIFDMWASMFCFQQHFKLPRIYLLQKRVTRQNSEKQGTKRIHRSSVIYALVQVLHPHNHSCNALNLQHIPVCSLCWIISTFSLVFFYFTLLYLVFWPVPLSLVWNSIPTYYTCFCLNSIEVWEHFQFLKQGELSEPSLYDSEFLVCLYFVPMVLLKKKKLLQSMLLKNSLLWHIYLFHV